MAPTAIVIDGYEAELDEVRALIDQQIDEEDRRDPTLLYVRATKLHATYTAATNELARLRAAAVSALHADRMSYAEIAAHLGISRGRVQQLIRKTAAADEAGAVTTRAAAEQDRRPDPPTRTPNPEEGQ